MNVGSGAVKSGAIWGTFPALQAITSLSGSCSWRTIGSNQRLGNGLRLQEPKPASVTGHSSNCGAQQVFEPHHWLCCGLAGQCGAHLLLPPLHCARRCAWGVSWCISCSTNVEQQPPTILIFPILALFLSSLQGRCWAWRNLMACGSCFRCRSLGIKACTF